MENKFRILTLAIASFATSLTLSGCGASGGASQSSGSTTTNVASGVLALPGATCGTNACVSGASAFTTGSLAVSSMATLHENADFGYRYINSTFIPLVNAKMYEVEKAFKDSGYDQCGDSTPAVATRQIDLIANGTYALNSSTSVTVSNGTLTAPWSTTKKFVISISGTAKIEVQIGCSNATTRAIYVRVKEGSDMFEAWGYQSISAKYIYAASDVGSSKRTLYFKSTSPTLFEIGAIANNATLSADSSPVTLAISGGANLAGGAGKLDVNLLMNGATAMTASTGATFDANEANYAGANKRHCFTALDPDAISTTASDCTGLFGGPASVYLRGMTAAMTNWSVNSLGSASISTTF